MNIPEKITTLVFDLGGVLVNLDGKPVRDVWLPEGETIEDGWTHWLHSSAVRDFEMGRINEIEFSERLIDEVGLIIGVDEFMQHFIRWPSGLFDGVPAILEDLGKKYRLAVLSNSNAVHWPLMMNDMRLKDYVAHCFSSHQIGVTKPDVAAFQTVIDALGGSPEEMLFLDDHHLNVEAAISCGMQAVKVEGSVGVKATLVALGLLPESSRG